MKPSTKCSLLAGALCLLLIPIPVVLAADSSERAAIVSEKIQAFRKGCAEGRNQITLTLEALTRLSTPGVELRPQFEKFKAELTKLEQQATAARERANTMMQKGEAFFADWEEQIKSIANEDIRKEAANRLAKRRKSYDRVISSMQDAREELQPLMSDLSDIRTLLEGELSASTVNSTKNLIRKANWHAGDAREALSDVEKELDRVTAEFNKYK